MVCDDAGYQERNTHNVYDCHAPLCWEVSSVSFWVTLHIWLSFIPQVRPCQSSWLYIRNTYTQRRRIRIFSTARFQIFRCNQQKQFLKNCRFLLSSFILLLFWKHIIFLSLFSYKKDKLFKSQKPGFCEYNAVFSLAHAAVEEQNAHTHMAHLQQHTRSLLIR